MLKGDNVKIRKVHGLVDIDIQKMKAFLQGAVYSWCITRRDEWFCVRDFIGGDNNYWQHCPLEVLYSRHINEGRSHDYAFDQATKDAGKILKIVLKEDARVFETEGGYTRRYRWRTQ